MEKKKKKKHNVFGRAHSTQKRGSKRVTLYFRYDNFYHYHQQFFDILKEGKSKKGWKIGRRNVAVDRYEKTLRHLHARSINCGYLGSLRKYECMRVT